MPTRYFGELPGLPVGTTWPTRLEASRAGVHRPTVPGISGTGAEGADSIVVSGGYEDDEDLGDELIYTGAGGNDPSTGRQIADQTLDQPGNAGLVTSQLRGLPVRVVRGSRGEAAHSPVSGYRYDGLYRVTEHWQERGRSGHLIWRFRLLRLGEQEAAPFVPAQNMPAGNPAPRATRGIVTRIIRSTVVSESVKRLYQSTCQLCSVALPVPGGNVSEGAHIRALGRPHDGPDVPGNVLCLCPNHHATFDQGGWFLHDDLRAEASDGSSLGYLNVARDHVLDVANIQYHRSLWGR